MIDGNDIRLLDLDYYRQNVGLVDQSVVLFDNTIRYNILFGLPDQDARASESDIDIQKIVKFYVDIQSIEKYSLILNQYAKDNLTWKAKLKPVVDEYTK